MMSKVTSGSAEPDSTNDLPAELFRQLVAQSSDVTVIMSSTGLLRYVSPAVLSAFGFQPESAPFSELLHWFHPMDRVQFETIFQSVLEEPVKICTQMRHHRGHWLDCSVLIQSLLPESVDWLGTSEEGIRWYFMSLRLMDASILHQQQSVDLFTQENEQTKSHFLAIMSHELRTPINAINGFSQLLLRQRRDRLTPEQEDMVQRILTNGKNLLSLINNVLDLSKLEAGRMRLHLESLNVANLIEETVEGISSLATQNNLTLNTEIHLSDPIIINDPLRLRQILMNLLSNAIKFSEGGQVWIVVEDAEPFQLRISVQDTGPGIASDDIEQVFSEFWQVDQLPCRHHQGTGLGLAICHNLARMMQGEI